MERLFTAKEVDEVILHPWWNYKGEKGNHAFGISEAKFIKKGYVLIYSSHISPRTNEPWSPYVYKVTWDLAKTCEPKPAKHGVHLRIVPVRDMEIVGVWWVKKEEPPAPKLFPEES